MRKFKPSIKTALASTLVITSTAAIVYATPIIIDSKNTERENKLKLAVEKVTGDTVKVALDNVQDIPKSLQFSIQLQGATLKDGTSSIKDLIKKEAEARVKSNSYSTNSNDVLVDYTYNEKNNTIDVLITSENTIPKVSNKIEILELNVKPESVNALSENELPTYKVVPSDNYEYKYVSNSNREYISKTVDHDNESISLNMSPTIKAGDTYIEVDKGQKLELTAENLGITMEDPEGKDITLEVKIDDKVVTEFASDTPGIYELSCTAIDNYGDRSETVTVQIYIADTTLTINADDKVIKVGDEFNPLDGVTVIDAEGNEIKNAKIDVKIENIDSSTEVSKVDTSKAGKYKITYTVENKGEVFIKEITVVVNSKMESINSAPVIIAMDKVIKLGETFDPLKGVTATDKEDKDLTSKIKYESNVDVNAEGEYTVTYTVEDSQGAKATKTIKVTVKKDILLADSITINNKFEKLYLGGSKVLNATINKEADIKDIEWTTSDENIASIEVVGNKAKIVAKSEGQVIITAKTTDGSNKSDSVTIDVVDFKNENIVQSFIKDVIDVNVVKPISGIGEVNSPLELEVQDIEVEEFEKFLKALEKLQPSLLESYESGNFTVYKIKLVRKAGLFRSASEAYIEIRVDNGLSRANDYKSSIDTLLANNDLEQPGQGGNTNEEDNQGTNQDQGNNGTTEDKKPSFGGDKLPVTGQESIIGYVGIAAVAIGGVLFGIKKKKKQ